MLFFILLSNTRPKKTGFLRKPNLLAGSDRIHRFCKNEKNLTLKKIIGEQSQVLEMLE